MMRISDNAPGIKPDEGLILRHFIIGFLALCAIFAVITLGLFWPSETVSTKDPFVMTEHSFSYDDFLKPRTEQGLSDLIYFHDIQSTMDDLRSGGFQYRQDDIIWRFTVPIDWAKPHTSLDAQRIIQHLVFSDPFLQSYLETKDVDDFRQAAFFLLNWQTFYQTGRRVTPYSWDAAAVRARAVRLAYILSEVNRDHTLLSRDVALSLMRLADFHVQRVTNPVYERVSGAEQTTILQTPEFNALCQTVNIPACTP